MVFVPSLAVEKLKKLRHFVTQFAKFTNAWSIHRGFYKLKTMGDDQKKFILQLAIDTKFFIAHLSILVQCETIGAVRAVCALLRIGHYVPNCQLLFEMARNL
jgi:hypothetical protein